MKLRQIVLAVFALQLAAVPAHAGAIVADTQQVATVLKAIGWKAEVSSVSGKPYIKSVTTKGYTFLMFFANCTSGSTGCKTVQLYAGFSPKQKPTLQQINDYAKSNRWGRCYIDKDGDPAIEMDIDLEQGGMSEALFKDNLEYWDAAVNGFAGEVMPATK